MDKAREKVGFGIHISVKPRSIIISSMDLERGDKNVSVTDFKSNSIQFNSIREILGAQDRGAAQTSLNCLSPKLVW